MQTVTGHGAGRGGEACEKFMNANSHRDAAPWGSRLSNFIRSCRVTSSLRVQSGRDETPDGTVRLAILVPVPCRDYATCAIAEWSGVEGVGGVQSKVRVRLNSGVKRGAKTGKMGKVRRRRLEGKVE